MARSAHHDARIHDNHQLHYPYDYFPIHYNFCIWAIMMDKHTCRIRVYEEPTTMTGQSTQISLSQTFVINAEEHFKWRIIRINHCHTDESYITYTTHDVNNRRWVNVMVP